MGGEVLGGGECSGRVAVARLALDGDFERFAEQAEDDRVLPDVVADSQAGWPCLISEQRWMCHFYEKLLLVKWRNLIVFGL